MPNITGTELAHQLKEISPQLPLIALSSLEESLVDLSCFEHKIDKPVNKLQLYECLTDVLSTKESPKSFYIGKQPRRESETFHQEKSKISVLVSEDVDYNCSVLCEMIRKLGYESIDTACDGEETIKKITSQNYQILLLDLKMPKLNGFDVIKYISDHNLSIEIIAVTASILDEDKEKCRDLGIKYFISKPINIKELQETLTYILCNLN